MKSTVVWRNAVVCTIIAGFIAKHGNPINYRLYSLLLLAFALSACVNLAPQSAAGLYNLKPGTQTVRGSLAHVEQNQLVDFTGKQVVQAVRQALGASDYQIDDYSKKTGLFAASTYHHCGGRYRLATTLAVYVTPIDTYPTTRIIVRADLLDGACETYDLQMQVSQITDQIRMKLEGS